MYLFLVDCPWNPLQVILASGEVIAYDVLVLATGSNGPFPVKFDDSFDTDKATELYQNAYKKVS